MVNSLPDRFDGEGLVRDVRSFAEPVCEVFAFEVGLLAGAFGARDR
jgi:hypothetical protein